MAANVRWQKATNCDKFVAAFCRHLTLVRMRLVSLAEWRRGWCLPKIARRYLRAAKQGDDGSQFSVGEMYEKGEGVMQDFVEAYKWFNIAAIAPDIDWNTATNFFKSNSIDVQTLNKFKASWVPVAGKAKAARDQLARQMTPDQIAEGQRRSAAFVPRKETPNSNFTPR